MSAEKCILNKREWLFTIIFISCHSEESTSTQACPGKPVIGAGAGGPRRQDLGWAAALIRARSASHGPWP